MGVAFFILYGTLYALGVFMADNNGISIWTIIIAVISIGLIRGVKNDNY